MAVIEARRNGVVPLRVSMVDIDLEEIGYPGWVVTMRTNPRASVYDDLLAVEDMGRWWRAFSLLVLEWNFADEDGEAIPLPREVPSEAEIDLPVGIIGFIYKRYIEEFRERVGLPKVPSANSETIYRTSDEPQTGE